jgi:hypothetical protein
MDALPDWNAVRYDPDTSKGHVESYFLKANDARGRRAVWLKATIYASELRPAHAVAEAWAIVFDREGKHVAVKESLPYAQTEFSKAGLDVTIGELLRFEQGATRGPIERGGHKIAWNLEIAAKDGGPLVHFPIAGMYTGPFPKSKLVSPAPSLEVTGSLTVDGHRTKVTGWRGMQGHNWGRGHADLYAWGHCNHWDQQEDLVVEAASARVRVGPVLTPLITLVCVRCQGKEFRLSDPMALLRNRGQLQSRRWFFSARNNEIAVEGDLSAQTADFVGLYYPNPDGVMTYCLNTKIANGRVRVELPGREPIDLTTRAAALEIGTKDPDHGVTMHV